MTTSPVLHSFFSLLPEFSLNEEQLLPDQQMAPALTSLSPQITFETTEEICGANKPVIGMTTGREEMSEEVLRNFWNI